MADPSPKLDAVGTSSHSGLTEGRPSAKTGLARSVISNWLGQVVLLASGFVLPRLLDDSLGAEELGVWDFAWSARNVIAMSSLGMGSSSNHHAARYQVSRQWDRLNRALSATLALVFYTVLLALVVTVGLVLVTPLLMQKETVELVESAQVLVAAMGFAAAMKMIQVVYGGSIAGFGRFDLLNLVQIVGDAILVAALFIVLALGGGLKIMALCLAINEVLRWAGKRQVFYHLCPHFRLRPRWADWEMFKEVATYGTKTLADSIATMVLNQAVMAFVLYYEGAALVAVLARPRALIRFTTRFLLGYARVLVSKSGELHDDQDKGRLAGLLMEGTRYALYLALPMAVLLLIMGGPVLRVWMGEDYVVPTVLAILVLGFLPFHVQRATHHVLMGIARHGVASFASLVAAALSVVMCVLLVGVLRWGLIGAALALAIPVGLVNLLVVPHAGCQAAGLPLATYWAKTIWAPVLAVLPFAVVLLASRLLLWDRPVLSLAVGLVVGGPVLLVVYWRMALPGRIKARIQGRLFARRTWSGSVENR
jgi:O-antigen/teichoic acid export membrane protein